MEAWKKDRITEITRLEREGKMTEAQKKERDELRYEYLGEWTMDAKNISLDEFKKGKTAKKPAVKKAVEKKAAEKKPAEKKAAAKKPAAKKPAEKKATAKKTAAKKPAAKKAK